MNGQSLAELSNAMIYSSMLVLFVAMFAFAASFAARKARVVDLRADQLGSARSAESADQRMAGQATAVAVSTQSLGASGEKVDASGRAESSSRSATDTTDVAHPSGGGGSARHITAEPGRRAGNIAMALSWLAFVMLLGGIVARGVWAERAPWGNMYEFSLTSALAVLGIFLVVSLRRDVRWLGVFVVPVVLLTLGLAVTVLYTEAAQLVPALQSYWLIIHVSAAIICGGAFMVAAAVALLYLASERATRPTKGALSRVIFAVGTRLPEPDRLDRFSFRLIAFSFPLWTFAVVAGAIWAESAWGRYWGWDPKETWAFITWVVYAGYLHSRTTPGWRGRKAAMLAVLGFLVYVFNYFGVNLVLPGLHSYAGV